MQRLLFFIFIATFLACGEQAPEPIDNVSTKFEEKRQDPSLDQQIQPILNQYFAVMAHLLEKDTVDLQVYGSNMIQLADSLTQQIRSKDTVTQSNAIQGLSNVQFEMTAILMESSPEERVMGAQMLSRHMIELLATIGYKKQTIYIFSDASDNQWIGLNKKSKNPYQQEDNVIYEANQVLQELK